MYDVVIIGLGPAGSTLARLLEPSFSVAAIDRKREGGTGFHKPCGGLLAQDAQKALSRFSLTLPKDVLVDPQIFAVRTLDLDSKLVRHYQRFYINLDRHKFDMWLRGLIPPRVHIYDDAVCTGVEQGDGCYHVRFLRNNSTHSITAKYVVGADGANSLVRQYAYPGKKIRCYTAIQEWYAESTLNPFYSSVFDSARTDCYSWTVSKDGFLIFGGAYPMKKSRLLFERQKQVLEDAGLPLGSAVKRESCLVLRPSRFSDFATGRDNIFLIGEAAGFISPSSLEGISGALYSAFYLSQALHSKKPKPCSIYRRKTRSLRLKLYLKTLKCPFMFWPPLRKLVMLSGLKSIPVEGDAATKGLYQA